VQRVVQGMIPTLSVRGLTTSFRIGDAWRDVVRGLTFDLAPRETLAIVGESGSGKSVAALSILRLLPERASRIEGGVRLEGRELTTLGPEDMRRVRGAGIAMIFQEPMTSLNPILPIGEQIAEAITCHGRMDQTAARAEAVRLIDRVRMSDAGRRFHEYPHQFSGGMRQRVMIAIALAGKPKVMIADEPTTALDVTIQGQILDLLKTVQEEEEMACLFITHDMGVVAQVADRMLVMRQGEAVETGATAQVFARPAAAYTRLLIESVPRLGSMHGTDAPAKFPPAAPEPLAPLPQTLQPILEVRGLTVRFFLRSGFLRRRAGAVHAVENASFDLRPGETLALVGESGCGKSTTARAIVRLIESSSGSVRLGGEEVLHLSGEALRRARREIQMVFQDPFASLDPRMTIGAALTEPFLDHGLGSKARARDKAAGLLRQVELAPDMFGRYPHEFSGGQRQRLAIARALMLDPKIIIADEAVSALDVSIKAQVCNLLIDLQRSFNVAYLFISHDMATVERISHRVAVMRQGEIVEIGPRRAVFDDPRHLYTRKLLAASPAPDPALRRAVRMPEVESVTSPFRPIGYTPPPARYVEISAQHYLREEAEPS
jgi:peptide/nickel transport system ATP-binding protein